MASDFLCMHHYIFIKNTLTISGRECGIHDITLIDRLFARSKIFDLSHSTYIARIYIICKIKLIIFILSNKQHVYKKKNMIKCNVFVLLNLMHNSINHLSIITNISRRKNGRD